MKTSGRSAARLAAPIELTRREVLYLIAAGAGVSWLGVPRSTATANGLSTLTAGAAVFTAEEFAILDAATARIMPTDSQPGARECGVVDYINSLLTYFPGSDANCDRHVNAADLTSMTLRLNGEIHGCAGGGDVDGNGVIDAADVLAGESAVFRARPVIAGGPFSGRQPQPHFPTGAAACSVCHSPAVPGMAAAATAAVTADNYPPDRFMEHLPLPRLRVLSWKIRLLGAGAVPEVAANPLATELLEVDLRNKYRLGLAALDAMSQQQFGAAFVALTPEQQSSVLDDSANLDFKTLLTYHTLEGMFGAPEYGGNRNGIGWQLIGFGGDSQPLGYTIYDPTVPGNYRERPDKPNSGPDRNETCEGFSPKVRNFLAFISAADLVQPGGPFPHPYCFR